MLICDVIKTSVGRLRPNFITVCQPKPDDGCRFWNFQNTMRRHRINELETQLKFQKGSNLEQANILYGRREFLLEARVALTLDDLGLDNNFDFENIKSRINRLQPPKKYFNQDEYCTQLDVLKMKTARTSFPSMTATISMYSTMTVIVGSFILHYEN
ncbi:hypothetical protein Ciccas_002493 [Cichlidogyrus casuarinus]|uniref:Uncharacterized protein n=1 Tax=Cichlidogyrus casuarinus TaxID=1844966 RepID=A0ABD2QH32_9PLAT